MTPRQELRLAWSDHLRSKLEREEEERREAAKLTRRCSRCKESVAADELCPGRYWCRRCENERRREHYQQTKARAA